MSLPRLARVVPGGMLALAALAVLASPAAAQPRCDRACLTGLMDGYLSALVAHSPAGARLAPGARITENAVEVHPGQGLWASAVRVGPVRQVYVDPTAGQAAFYGLVEEASGPAIVGVRIRVARGRITEAETVVTRKGERLFNVEGLAAHQPVVATTGPRPSRQALIAMADGFFQAMQDHSGATVQRTADCIRLESGAGGEAACNAGFERLVQISAVGHRRYAVVDEAAGVVVATAVYMRPPGALMPNGQPWKRNLLMTVFTTANGMVSGVYSVTHYLEPEEPDSTGWPD